MRILIPSADAMSRPPPSGQSAFYVAWPNCGGPPFERRKRRGAENCHHVCDGIDYRFAFIILPACCEPNSFAFSYQLRANEMSETCVPKR